MGLNSDYSSFQSDYSYNQPIENGEQTSEINNISQQSLDPAKYESEIARIKKEFATNPDKARTDAQVLKMQVDMSYESERVQIFKDYNIGTPAFKDEISKLKEKYEPLFKDMSDLLNDLNSNPNSNLNPNLNPNPNPNESIQTILDQVGKVNR